MSNPLREPGTQGDAHLLTVSVEDYFHAQAFKGTVAVKHWDRIESRLKANIDDILLFLDRFHVRATFFVLGWTAERQPELIRSISSAGHEIASRGYWPRGAKGMVPEEFRSDLRRTAEVLRAAGAKNILGFRSPQWIRAEEAWILDVLAEEGYSYDSSINPVLRRFARDPRRFRIHRHRHFASDLTIWEFPISTASLLGWRFAISGGNYVRQLPHTLLRQAVARWNRREETPLVFYFMPWELDSEQPHIEAISPLMKIRHYRNLSKTRWVLEEYFGRYRFGPIADYLTARGERPSLILPRSSPIEVASLEVGPDPQQPREDVTVVVPLFNEKQNIAYLRQTLLGLRHRLADRYRIRFCVVDDGSSDGTWEALQSKFAGVPDFEAHRHPANRGVAAAILTGITHASTEIVCSIDCDCSYDPNILEEMIPLLQQAEIVTASPYHPAGSTFNVPGWRLFLSRSLSRLYSLLLDENLHTYTSCCRALKKSAVMGLTLKYDDFLGVAEMLIRAKLAGARVREYPAILEARLFGESKMKTLRTIRRHLNLLAELAWRRAERVRRTRTEPGAPSREGGSRPS